MILNTEQQLKYPAKENGWLVVIPEKKQNVIKSAFQLV